MRRYMMFILLFGVVLSLTAAPLPPAQVKITLTTKVPEFLAHGFLKEDQTLASFTTVDDAFNVDGAVFTYAVVTNVSYPLKISAEVTPFSGNQESTVSIKEIYYKRGEEGQEFSAEHLGSGSLGEEWDLFSLTPDVSGMATYAYTLRVVADQDEVEEAKAGDYESTVSIKISTTI